MSDRSRPPNDLELAERAFRGDVDATATLVNRALPKVRGLAWRLAGEAEEGDSLAQEALVVALESLERYRGDASFATWVCAIALRRNAERRRRDSLEQRSRERGGRPPQVDPAQIVAEKDLAQRVWSLVAALPPSHSAALIARATNDSTAQAAAELGITPNAMRVRLHRARFALRELLLSHHSDLLEELNHGQR